MKKIVLGIILAIGSLSAKYNQIDAAAYALTYAEHPNPHYRYYNGGDCTNFISQALKAGGIRYDYNGNSGFQKWYKYSESWQWAPTFRRRAYYGGFGAKKIRKYQLEVGDLVLFDWKGSPYRFQHSTMVTNVEVDIWGRKYFYVSYHSNNKKNVSLDWIINTYDPDRVEYYRPRW